MTKLMFFWLPFNTLANDKTLSTRDFSQISVLKNILQKEFQ